MMTSTVLEARAWTDDDDLEASIRSIAHLAGTDLSAASEQSKTLLGRDARLSGQEQLLALAREVGLLSSFGERAREFVTTKTRPWPGTGYDRASDDPHVLRRFGRFVALSTALDELFAECVRSAVEGSSANAQGVAIARALAAQIGETEISGIIELLGAGSASEKHGFHLFWLNFQTHRLANPPKHVAIGDFTEFSS